MSKECIHFFWATLYIRTGLPFKRKSASVVRTHRTENLYLH